MNSNLCFMFNTMKYYLETKLKSTYHKELLWIENHKSLNLTYMLLNIFTTGLHNSKQK